MPAGQGEAAPVVHFELHGRDAERMRGFYAAVFGWRTDAANPWNYGMVEAGIDGGLLVSDGEPAVIVYLAVPDIDAALAAVARHGGRTILPRMAHPGTIPMAVFEDTEGNRVGLMERGR